jgi:hypothetical protein
MHPKPDCFFLLAATFALAPALGAQSAEGLPPRPDRVTLNVSVTDDHDQAVEGLTSKDFQVSDEGMRQQIVSVGRIGRHAQPVVG